MYDLINYECGYDLKNRLLLCLINNYYSRKYENNQNCKIVFISQDKAKLMQQYSNIYEMIKNYKVSDIYALKKFYNKRFKDEDDIFRKLEESKINVNVLLKKIQKEYTEHKSIYFDRLDSSNIKDEINIVFTTNFSMNNIYNKYLIKDVFLLDILNKYGFLDSNYDKSFIGAIQECVKEYNKVFQIGKTLFNQKKRINLNIYLSGSIEVADYIDNELDKFFRDEGDDD